MPKPFLKAAALLLIPCLLADSASAAWAFASAPAARPAVHLSDSGLFSRQATVTFLTHFLRPFYRGPRARQNRELSQPLRHLMFNPVLHPDTRKIAHPDWRPPLEVVVLHPAPASQRRSGWTLHDRNVRPLISPLSLMEGLANAVEQQVRSLPFGQEDIRQRVYNTRVRLEIADGPFDEETFFPKIKGDPILIRLNRALFTQERRSARPGAFHEAAGWLVHGKHMPQAQLTAGTWGIVRDISEQAFLDAYGHLRLAPMRWGRQLLTGFTLQVFFEALPSPEKQDLSRSQLELLVEHVLIDLDRRFPEQNIRERNLTPNPVVNEQEVLLNPEWENPEAVVQLRYAYAPDRHQKGWKAVEGTTLDDARVQMSLLELEAGFEAHLLGRRDAAVIREKLKRAPVRLEIGPGPFDEETFFPRRGGATIVVRLHPRIFEPGYEAERIGAFFELAGWLVYGKDKKQSALTALTWVEILRVAGEEAFLAVYGHLQLDPFRWLGQWRVGATVGQLFAELPSGEKSHYASTFWEPVIEAIITHLNRRFRSLKVRERHLTPSQVTTLTDRRAPPLQAFENLKVFQPVGNFSAVLTGEWQQQTWFIKVSLLETDFGVRERDVYRYLNAYSQHVSKRWLAGILSEEDLRVLYSAIDQEPALKKHVQEIRLPGRLYLAIPRIPQLSVEQHIEQIEIDTRAPEVRESEVMNVLQALYRMWGDLMFLSVQHRDLGPAEIMLEFTPRRIRTMLVDFALSVTRVHPLKTILEIYRTTYKMGSILDGTPEFRRDLDALLRITMKYADALKPLSALHYWLGALRSLPFIPSVPAMSRYLDEAQRHAGETSPADLTAPAFRVMVHEIHQAISRLRAESSAENDTPQNVSGGLVFKFYSQLTPAERKSLHLEQLQHESQLPYEDSFWDARVFGFNGAHTVPNEKYDALVAYTVNDHMPVAANAFFLLEGIPVVRDAGLFVTESHRRSGIASRLQDELIRSMRLRGYRSLISGPLLFRTRITNLVSRDMYVLLHETYEGRAFQEARMGQDGTYSIGGRAMIVDLQRYRPDSHRVRTSLDHRLEHIPLNAAMKEKLIRINDHLTAIERHTTKDHKMALALAISLIQSESWPREVILALDSLTDRLERRFEEADHDKAALDGWRSVILRQLSVPTNLMLTGNNTGMLHVGLVFGAAALTGLVAAAGPWVSQVFGGVDPVSLIAGLSAVALSPTPLKDRGPMQRVMQAAA